MDETELERAKAKLNSSVVIGGESTNERVMGLISSWLTQGRLETLEEVRTKIDQVTLAGPEETCSTINRSGRIRSSPPSVRFLRRSCRFRRKRKVIVGYVVNLDRRNEEPALSRRTRRPVPLSRAQRCDLSRSRITRFLSRMAMPVESSQLDA